MKIEVWSDIVCPWCYIGQRRLEKALASYEGTAEVVWRSFQLDPTQTRGENVPTVEMLSRKYGVSPAEAAAMNDRVTGLAAEEGLTYQLDKALTANTFDAHRLAHFAATRELGNAMHERLLRAALTEGEAVDHTDTLVRLATEVGLPAEEARAVLDGDDFAEDVRADIADAHALGARGVPFYVIDRAYGISGAQPADAILDVLRKASSTVAS
ncbi:DsbA family oxidoreductase [Amycolatopsis sp. YIM 10]|uniref:DsbA family oxidoreductase n=1 Tax=Amycolatopsis sp. YIM 10 TaxID=2653857 RepID=UPI00128FDA62|nr:DsbA family oxidoreductase [Amycolatopsis sp. YIM 10]QFU91184.1 DSBA-like thioredoxin domain protein [Amycolatopsis sp. YIM 10]